MARASIRTLTPTVLFALLAGSSAHADPAVIGRPVLIDNNARLINASGPSQVVRKGETLRVNVLRAAPGICADVKLTIDGKSRTLKNASFPLALDIAPTDPIYPTKGGKYDLAIDGVAGCTGHLTYTFAFNPSGKGQVTDVQISGFESPATAQVKIDGHGLCRIRVATYKAPYVHATATPGEMIFFDAPTALPMTVPLKRSAEIAAQWGGDYVIEILSMGTKWGDGAPDDSSKKAYPSFEGCAVSGPGTVDGNFVIRKTFTTQKAGQASNNTNNGGSSGSSGGSPPPGGGGNVPSSPKPATGKISNVLVPGGSFAEDEAQKLQVNGTGGCAMDLTLSNKSYGGSDEKTWPVLPRKLDGGTTLYNGTDFGTLAEGSWKASVVGKNGCTGNATIDFKVTAKTSTKKVSGQPTLSFDQAPKGGGNTFWRTKDSNIWFKVVVPQSVKDEPYAGCCDVEFDYMNEYGGWEPLPNSPFNDASWGLAVTQQAGVAFKSVSGFTQGTRWRVKMRAYKFKTQFDWSDWLEFNVNQN
jgi:hypothetical protein